MSPFSIVDLPAPRWPASQARKRKGVAIGSRWKPGHRVMRDDSAGIYAEVNSLMLSDAERLVQRALLIPTRPTFWQRVLRRLRGVRR